jgi:hypothetical protein
LVLCNFFKHKKYFLNIQAIKRTFYLVEALGGNVRVNLSGSFPKFPIKVTLFNPRIGFM